jgi:predicted O-methyltransferase YrrM
MLSLRQPQVFCSSFGRFVVFMSCVVFVSFVSFVVLRAQPPSRTLSPQITSVLDSIRAADEGQLAISEEDGRFLRVLVATRGAKTILEIGAASGYSSIWLGLGARQTGGRVVSIEYDPQRAKEAIANVKKAGLDDVVRVVHGDAFREIPRVPGTFDLVFPRLAPAGVFVAHNVVNKASEMKPFLDTIHSHPDLLTSVVSPSGEGMSISYKTR